MAHGLKKRKNIPAEVVNSHLALGAFSDSFNFSNPGQSYSQQSGAFPLLEMRKTIP